MDDLALIFEEIPNNDKFIYKDDVNKVVYKGLSYEFTVEVSFIDTDRQMGNEVIYEVCIEDDQNNSVAIASVSEYPEGVFKIFSIHKESIFNEAAVVEAVKKISRSQNRFDDYLYE